MNATFIRETAIKRISYLGIFSMLYVVYEFINWILADEMILTLKALF